MLGLTNVRPARLLRTPLLHRARMQRQRLPHEIERTGYQPTQSSRAAGERGGQIRRFKNLRRANPFSNPKHTRCNFSQLP
jgi:hypothetical protein